jgi:hypothetical protein
MANGVNTKWSPALWSHAFVVTSFVATSFVATSFVATSFVDMLVPLDLARVHPDIFYYTYT